MPYKLGILQSLFVVCRPDLVGAEPRAERALVDAAHHPLIAQSHRRVILNIPHTDSECVLAIVVQDSWRDWEVDLASNLRHVLEVV